MLTLLNIVASIADILSIAFLFVVINFYSPQNIAVNASLLPGDHFQKGSLIPAVLLLVVFFVKSFFGYAVSKMHYKFINNVASDMSAQNMLHYLEGNYSDYINIDSASFVRKICFQPIEFAHYILSGFLQTITEVILITLTVVALLLYDATLLLIISAVLLPAICFLTYITKRRLSGIRKSISQSNEHNIQFLHEALSGYVESNVYDKNELFAERYSKMQQVVNNYVADMQITQVMPSRFFETFAVFGLFLFIIAGQFISSENATGVFTLGAYMAAAYKIIPGISKIINVNSTAKTYHYAMDELLKSKSVVTAQKINNAEQKIDAIQFRNVYFSYNEKVVVDNFNCTFNKASFTGIKGDSGKGKTTLINLLLGFLQPSKGEIFFNEERTTELKRKAYWPGISYVKQEPFMLHDSIRKNITLFDNNYNEELLNIVIKKSLLEDFINSLPEGLDKIITENGKNISGGQRQRIAIARALYKNADVIILDEPFNELDEDAELSLMKYFKQLTETGKIIILITHNNNSLQFCNNIISLNE